MNATTPATVESVARQAGSYFTRIRRGEETITTFTDDRPDWLYDAVYEAHGSMLPDDWKFACCELAVDAIADAGEDADLDDLAHEFADGQADVYNADRLKWLASHMDRVYYVEDAVKEFGTPTDEDGQFDLLRVIGLGQYAEAMECFNAMRSAIEAEVERRNEEADDE